MTRPAGQAEQRESKDSERTARDADGAQSRPDRRSPNGCRCGSGRATSSAGCTRSTPRIFFEECDDFGITPVQYGLLTMLSTNPDSDQVTLANALGIDRTNVADVLVRLEQRGLRRADRASTIGAWCSPG